MKVIVTGSLGHIGRPLTELLVKDGHSVTVISSNPQKQKEIETLEASAAIGSIEDTVFLTQVFEGADIVYCMIPPGNYFNADFDMIQHCSKMANSYTRAILQAGVKRVILLSSIGAHMDKDNGILSSCYMLEHIFNGLPTDIAVTCMRPVGFYYNLMSFVHSIKTSGVITSNYGGEQARPWVAPADIAAAIEEEVSEMYVGRKVRYVASEEISCTEIAAILGEAIGKPDLQWRVIPDEQQLNRMITAGMNPKIAAGLVEMNASIQSGKLYEDYYRNRPMLGKTKIKDFAKEFAVAYDAAS
ncbi:MAG: NAD(P)H-binding protein [Bacteroidota bacterium]|nr:NAD(P)H-binding protein [Bacteroidota bacterium]